MFDTHAYKVLYNFVDNSYLYESSVEVDRKKLGAMIYATISREYSILNFLHYVFDSCLMRRESKV